jgi:hypothetical protein
MVGSNPQDSPDGRGPSLANFGFEILALLWHILAIDWRNWIPESGFQ